MDANGTGRVDARFGCGLDLMGGVGHAMGRHRPLGARTRIPAGLRLPRRYGAAARLAGFALVGASGFVIDVSVYVGLQAIGVKHRVARFLSFWPAVTWNWVLNRGLTFEERVRQPHVRQWTKFVASSMIGLTVNVGSYAMLTSFVGFFARHHLPALIVGVGLGGFTDFLVANRYVYRRRTEAEPCDDGLLPQ